MTGIEFSRQQTVNQLSHGYGALPYGYGYPTGSFQPSWSSAWTMTGQNSQEQVSLNQPTDNSSPDPNSGSNSIANTSTGTNQSTPPPPQVNSQNHDNHDEVGYHQMNHFSIQGHVYQPTIQVNIYNI